MTSGSLREAAGKHDAGRDDHEEFSRTLPVDTLQPPYHLFRGDVEASILPYARAHDIGALVYGTLGHGLLSGAMTLETHFPPEDWRSRSDAFKGEPYQRNLRIVEALERFAEVELGATVSRLAVAWALANPAVHVAIGGTRNPRHIEEAITAADLALDEQAMHPARRDRPRRGPHRRTQPGVGVRRSDTSKGPKARGPAST